MTILNLPFLSMKPILLHSEMKSLHKCFNEETMSVKQFCRASNKLMVDIMNMKTMDEMVYFVMERTDFTQKEAMTYINNLYFDETFQYN